jgi:hypothetical protein
MFGVGVGVRVGGFTPVSSGGGFDPDAQAFFDRVTTAGGTLSETEKTATNQLVLDMKSAGIWSSMKAIYPMVGASAAACAQNLKSSSFTGTFTSGWTFASTGVTPNGTSAFMNTNLPINTMAQNSTHNSLYCRLTMSNTGARTDIGGAASYYFGAFYGFGLGLIGNLNNGGVFFTANANSQGFYTFSRLTSTGKKVFKNGSSYFVTSDTSTAPATSNITIGTNGTEFAANEYAFSSFGDGLNDTQMSNYYTAVQAFQTTLSRNV